MAIETKWKDKADAGLERLERQLNKILKFTLISVASDIVAVGETRERGLLVSRRTTGGRDFSPAGSGDPEASDSAFNLGCQASDGGGMVFSGTSRQGKEATLDINTLKDKEIKRWFRSEGIRLIKEAQAEGYLD